MALVVRRSRSPPHDDSVLPGFLSELVPTSTSLSCSLTASSHSIDHVRGMVFGVSLRIGILRLVKRIFVETSVLLR